MDKTARTPITRKQEEELLGSISSRTSSSFPVACRQRHRRPIGNEQQASSPASFGAAGGPHRHTVANSSRFVVPRPSRPHGRARYAAPGA